MDNVTHTLVGLMIARTFKRCPPGTPVMMMVAANMPDLDVVSGLRGSLSYLENHRGYLHAVASAPLMALFPLIVLVFFRQKISLLTYLFSLIGVLSHLLLDWTNVYGIRLLLPMSDRWLRLDSTDIVDPWILSILILAVAAPALAKLVSSEIGSRSGQGAKLGWAWFALVALAAYDGGRYAAHQRALAVMSTRLFEGAPARRITALPSRVNPVRWRGVVEGDGFVVFVPVDLTEEFDPSSGRIVYPASSGPEIDAARRTAAFEVFGKFSQAPFWKVTRLGDATQVELIDLRFGTPSHPGFEAVAMVDPSGAVRESQFTFGGLPVKAP